MGCMAKPGLSSPFDVKTVLSSIKAIAILTEVVILIDRILEHCVANVSRRLPVMFLQNGLKLLAQGSVAAVVHTIGVQDKYVTGAHQSDLSDIGRVKFFLPEGQGVVSLAVRMICGNLQTERKEFHHATFIDLQELAIFCRKYQWRRMSEIREPKVPARAHLAVKHGGNFPRIFPFIHPQ